MALLGAHVGTGVGEGRCVTLRSVRYGWPAGRPGLAWRSWWALSVMAAGRRCLADITELIYAD